MILKKDGYVITVILLLLGIALSLQFRSVFNVTKQKNANRLDAEKLIAQIQTELDNEKKLKAEIDNGLELKENLIRSYISGVQDGAVLKEWEDARLKANLTRVEGPGVEIILNDAAVRTDNDPNLLIIHDSDIRIILNDLKKAGACAISINDERIIPVSEQVCAGPTIRINRQRYSVPYIIRAIGDPETLASSIKQSERVMLMERDGIRIKIAKMQQLTIPAFNNHKRYISGLEAVNK